MQNHPRAAPWPLYVVVLRPGFVGPLSTCIAIALSNGHR